MNRSINISHLVSRSPLCLLCLIGLAVFAPPVAAQVFDSGPSDPALFDTVINVPPAPDIGLNGVIGGDGSTTQLNVSDGGSVERFFAANSGAEVNISGGEIRQLFTANSGSEVNISGGSIGNDFLALPGSEINLVGTGFFIDGVLLSGSLSIGRPFTIVDRDVTLSGRLDDGTAFSFNLNPNPPVFEPDGDYFDSDATLTVTQTVFLGDQGDGIVNFLDIQWFVCELGKTPYRAAADINQDGSVDFLDIMPFIDLLAAGN